MAQYPKRNEYNALSKEAKEKLLREIGERCGAQWQGMTEFSRWGQELTTAVFHLHGGEFLFIPGDTITLGWDGFQYPAGDGQAELVEALLTDLNGYFGTFTTEEQVVDALCELTTPVRQAVIPPMLVEREARPFEDGTPVSLETDITLSGSAQESLEKFLASNSTTLVLDSMETGNPKLRFKKQAGGLLTEMIYPATAAHLQARLEKDGMTLPNLDQWEYLCGGGCRTLFAWGDSLEFCDGQSWKQQPNFFGLTISFHPYRWEVIRDDCRRKGADGGNMECVGRFKALNDLPASPYFAGWITPEEWEEVNADGLSEQYDYYRRIIQLE